MKLARFFDSRPARTGVGLARRRSTAGIAGGCACALAAVVFDHLCGSYKAAGHNRREALSDGAAHVAASLAVAAPAAPFVAEPGRFLGVAALSAVAIDLDHVVAARSLALIPCMSMPQRPATHSVLTLGLLTYLAERVQPGRQTELAISLGLGSHLLRDIATGGAPLFMPRRVVEVARTPAAAMMAGLTIAGRWYARKMLDPQRPRRSNPAVLAPELLIANSRARRAARSSGRAA